MGSTQFALTPGKRSGRLALRRDLAPPLDPVAVLRGERLDRLLRLGDLDPRDLPVEAAPRALPGDFLAEPFPFEEVDDQALHVSGPRTSDARPSQTENGRGLIIS